MSEHNEFLADSQEDQFEKEMRGYSRRQVDEFVARARSQSRDLEDRLARSLDDNERLRLELSSARQSSDVKPEHVVISERVGQILKLADDEAKAQKSRAADEIAKLRNDVKQETEKLRAEVKQETDKFRNDAQQQAERMLGAAQEEAENSIASARAEADKTRNAARTEAERSVTDAHKQAETALSSSKAQAKQVLDEATARATAIHDGAERRLNLLMSRHSEAIRRLTEIRDVVTGLVAGEVARGSLEEEVAKAVANAVGEGQQQQQPGLAGNGNRGQAIPEGRHAPGGPAGVQSASGRQAAADALRRPGADPQRDPLRGPAGGDPLRGPGGPDPRAPQGDPLRAPQGDPLRGPAGGDPLRGPGGPDPRAPQGDPLRGSVGPGAPAGPGGPGQGAGPGGPGQGAGPGGPGQGAGPGGPGQGEAAPAGAGPRQASAAGRADHGRPRDREAEGQDDTGQQPTPGDGAKHAAGSPPQPSPSQRP
jgi:cell division septum initiation protein DivIVA